MADESGLSETAQQIIEKRRLDREDLDRQIEERKRELERQQANGWS